MNGENIHTEANALKADGWVISIYPLLVIFRHWIRKNVWKLVCLFLPVVACAKICYHFNLIVQTTSSCLHNLTLFNIFLIYGFRDLESKFSPYCKKWLTDVGPIWLFATRWKANILCHPSVVGTIKSAPGLHMHMHMSTCGDYPV
jgi:hypothetical protein